MELPYSVDLKSRFPDPTRQRPELRRRVRDWHADWSAELRKSAEAWRAELWLRSRPIVVAASRAEPEAQTALAGVADGEGDADARDAGAVAPSPDSGVPLPPADQTAELLPDVISQYADLGIAVQGRVEMGGGWNRFRPCDVTIQLNCDPGLFPTLQPDIQFGARVGGTISDRIHVSVDYDNRREFDAANNINVFYQGFEDEILQRIEVGDVTFPLPQSRFLTQGIPAGNFGFRATGQMGPIDFQTVWAQQKGDVGTRELQVGGGGQGFEQTATTILDDADYERGRFFFILNPRRLNGYPHIDIQRLIAADAPPDLRPASAVKVYRYESNVIGVGSQIPEGFITAVAVAVDTVKTELGADTVVTDTLSGLFRPLVSGEDYVLHQSGLWLQLRNTLPDREGLAVTYVADDGSEVGTFNAEEVSDAHNADPDAVSPPLLELVKSVNHRPRTATWLREMHHVYRVSASPGVVKSSIQLIVSQGDPELGNTFRAAPDATQLEFLKIFGLDDDPTDNLLDDAQIYEVEVETADVSAGPTGTYIVPPTLEPFRAPPPLRDVGGGLEGEEFPLVPGDRNSSIYDEPNDQVRRGANLYLLTITYRQRFEGFLSTISLGTGGVREESERLVIDGIELVRGEDYSVDYDIGQIELREPERWFRNKPDATVRVTFEQKPLFQLAPTSVFGFQARYGLGRNGEISFIGLSQTEKTLQTRPELGLEPSSVQLGGISGRFSFQPAWLTDMVDALPGVEAEAASTISIDGEMAISLPKTNTQGVTFVEDFEGGPGFSISPISRAWRLGSAPATNAGAETVSPLSYDTDNAAEIVWQDQYVVQTTEGPQIVGGLLPEEIDQELQIQGQLRPEAVLTITAKQPGNRQIAPNPSPPPGLAWRSMTTVISPNGQDFTNVEFFEFYVAALESQADSINLIIDLGTVSEDAWAIDSVGSPSGLGTLNREVVPPQIWSRDIDLGLWGSGCRAEPAVRAYPLGDVRANCTNNNGLEDTEDLNQNSVLDSDERFFRYVLTVGDRSSPYFVRDAEDFAGARFRLFRIPLRRPDHRERVTDAEFQNIRHMRITVTSTLDPAIILARMRFLGSRWLKRGRSGILAGLTDTTSAVDPASLVEVGPISTLDSRYVPPPGITDQVANQTDQFNIGGAGTAFNEQSLDIRFSELGPGERAEVFLQYPQTPRDLLAYRSLRIWALGADGPWGRSGAPLEFIVKLGEDRGNFYLFKTALRAVPPDADAVAVRQAWLPEIVVDFDRFMALRARAEEILLREGGLQADSVLQVWDTDVFEDGDSSYAVVISQRSRAPNLAAVRQISLGAYNSGSATIPVGELWVDDVRLGSTVDNAGIVRQLNVDVRASDVLGLSLRLLGENPYFRQLGASPSFRSRDEFSLASNLQFGKFLPDAWALQLPLTFSYSNSSTESVLLPRTDIQAGQLRGLRNPQLQSLRFGMSLSRTTRDYTPIVGWLVDNSSMRLGYERRSSQSTRSLAESNGLSAGYSFRSDVADLSLPIGKLFFFLPSAIKNAGLRLTPRNVQLNTSFVDSETETRRFEEIIKLPSDRGAVPVRTLDKRLRNDASVDLEPFTSLTGRVSVAQDRELIPTRELVKGTAARSLIRAERNSLAGVDLGWETARSMNANLTFRPSVVSWLTPQASFASRFRFDRRASYITEQEGDTVLTRDFNNSRNLRASVGFNTAGLFRSLLGPREAGPLSFLQGLLDRIDIITATWAGSRSSNFSRQTASPNFGYQMALGGFEAFQVQDGDTASRVSEGETVSLASGVRLPLGIGVNADYLRSNGMVWTPITRSRSRSTGWPNLNVAWNRVPIPAILQRWVQNIGVRSGYRVQKSRNIVIAADQTRENETKTLPLSVSVALTTGWTLSYSMTQTDEERRDPTGVTLSDQSNHSIQVTGRIEGPTRRGNVKTPIRTSLRYTQSDRDECRRLGNPIGAEAETPVCELFTDQRIRTVDITVDTDFPPFVLGLQGTWRDSQSEIGQRPGSTQLEITLFGQFLFETGTIR